MSYLSHADNNTGYCGQLNVASSFTQSDTNNVSNTENTKTDACPKDCKTTIKLLLRLYTISIKLLWIIDASGHNNDKPSGA